MGSNSPTSNPRMANTVHLLHEIPISCTISIWSTAYSRSLDLERTTAVRQTSLLNDNSGTERPCFSARSWVHSVTCSVPSRSRYSTSCRDLSRDTVVLLYQEICPQTRISVAPNGTKTCAPVFRTKPFWSGHTSAKRKPRVQSWSPTDALVFDSVHNRSIPPDSPVRTRGHRAWRSLATGRSTTLECLRTVRWSLVPVRRCLVAGGVGPSPPRVSCTPTK